MANQDPDYPIISFPIRQFKRVETARLVDALNTLINDVNAAVLSQGISSGGLLNSFTVATLPAALDGTIAFASNGRKIGEGAGAGTGVVVYSSAGTWRVVSLDSPILS